MTIREVLKADWNIDKINVTVKCGDCDYYKEKNCKHQCMYLPDGKTCADCKHSERCTTIFGAKLENTSCGFEPIRFCQKN